jgi:hypothetical protein
VYHIIMFTHLKMYLFDSGREPIGSSTAINLDKQLLV